MTCADTVPWLINHLSGIGQFVVIVMLLYGVYKIVLHMIRWL